MPKPELFRLQPHNKKHGMRALKAIHARMPKKLRKRIIIPRYYEIPKVANEQQLLQEGDWVKNGAI